MLRFSGELYCSADAPRGFPLLLERAHHTKAEIVSFRSCILVIYIADFTVTC